MKPVKKSVQIIVLLEILVLAAGYFIVSKSGLEVSFSELAVLSLVFMAISIITLIIFFRGQSKDPAPQALHSMLAVIVKFLLELILAFAWFFIAKKRGLSSVVLFFVLYLTFTLFSLMIIVKTLKNSSNN